MAKQVETPKVYPIPANWKWVELGKMVKILNGYPFKSSLFSDDKNGRRPLIRIRDVMNGNSVTYTDENCPDEYIVHKGEILIGMDGDFNISRWQSDDALLNQRVCKIESISNLLLDDYMYYFLPETLKKINDATPSITVKHLSAKTIEKILIPIPPTQEQHRIVEQIERLFYKLDEAIEKTNIVIEDLETQLQAVLHDAFTGKLTSQWRLKNGISSFGIKASLAELVKDIKYGCSEKSEYNFTGTPVLRIPNIDNGEINFSDMKYLRDTLDNNSYEIIENDILVIRSNGSRDLVGKCALVPKLDQRYAYASFLIRLKTNDKVIPKYLSMFINSAMARRQLFVKAKSSSGIHNINSKELGAVSILVPSIEEQIEILNISDDLLKNIHYAKANAEETRDNVEKVKKAVLTKAFRGELGTNDPSEDSSIELLKQILQ